MKHLDNCDKDFDTKEAARSVCGAKLRKIVPDETETVEIVSTMTLTGIL